MPAIENAAGPERRMTASALRPGAVDNATIVSSSPGIGAGTIRLSIAGVVLEGIAGFEDSYVISPYVVGEKGLQPVDRVISPRRYMLECAPMIGDQVARLEPVEQIECVIGAKMATTKPGLPPGSIPNW